MKKSLTDQGTKEFAEQNHIPHDILQEITQECTLISHKTINYFIQIVREQFRDKHFYNVSGPYDKPQFYQRRNIHAKDVQILAASLKVTSAEMFSSKATNSSIQDYVCVSYEPKKGAQMENNRVFIYGSHGIISRKSAFNNLDALYPNDPDIVYKQKSQRTIYRNTGLIAIVHMTSLLLTNNDPKARAPNQLNQPTPEYQLNRVVGDVHLQIRSHLVKIFKERKLCPFPLDNTEDYDQIERRLDELPIAI